MSNLPDYDEITRLRLRLAEVELQRDAFKAMAVKAVTEVIREVLQKEKAPAIDYASLAKGYDEKPIGTDFTGLLKRVETLEEDGNIVDGIIDRVSQRVDHLETFPASELRDAMMVIKLTLERTDARLKRLETKSNG